MSENGLGWYSSEGQGKTNAAMEIGNKRDSPRSQMIQLSLPKQGVQAPEGGGWKCLAHHVSSLLALSKMCGMMCH